MTSAGGAGPPAMTKLQCFFLSFRKAARINLATSHRTLHDVDALAFEPSAQLVYRLFARVSEVRRDLWVWGKVERAFPCRLETKAELQRFALDFFVGRRLMLVCHTQLSFATLFVSVVFNSLVVVINPVLKALFDSEYFVNIALSPFLVESSRSPYFGHIFLVCSNRKCGVNMCAICANVITRELWVPANSENYIPKRLSFSHNFKQSITIYFKSQLFFSTFLVFFVALFLSCRFLVYRFFS